MAVMGGTPVVVTAVDTVLVGFQSTLQKTVTYVICIACGTLQNSKNIFIFNNYIFIFNNFVFIFNNFIFIFIIFY